MTKLCLKTRDHEGRQVIFTEKQRVLKGRKHPELRDSNFISGRVKRTIEQPDFIYEDLARPANRRAIYALEYFSSTGPRYTKVIVETKLDGDHSIVTAFRPNSVKERAKSKLIYGKDQ